MRAKAASITPQESGVKARLRGISAVDSKIAWASGSRGTCLRTVDGGATWEKIAVPGSDKLDFRDIEAFDRNTAYLLSIGEGESSRIYKTTDGGKNWQITFTNHNPKAFFDAIAFWDVNNGLALSDPVEGHFIIIKTTDGGKTWNEIPSKNIPAAIEKEGAFAASGTCLITRGKNDAFFVTGGGAARVFRSSDRGNTWQVSNTPIVSGEASSGIFSIAFKDAAHGMIVGGDYKKENKAHNNVAVTEDGGKKWRLVTATNLGGYRSAVAYLPDGSGILAVGPSGSDFSADNGATWTSVEVTSYDAFSFAPHTDIGWAVGEQGHIGKYTQVKSK
ncbi:MAG TPA: hypothetical protein VFC63_19625 [Blastocatellia bacterium]|nr:hypothetical protein [Blastocatellia bacterium]